MIRLRHLFSFMLADVEFLKNQYIYSGIHRLRYRILVYIRKNIRQQLRFQLTALLHQQ